MATYCVVLSIYLYLYQTIGNNPRETLKLNTMNNTGFIEQTAMDYDMGVWQVQNIYNKWGAELFYKKLEEYIKQL